MDTRVKRTIGPIMDETCDKRVIAGARLRIRCCSNAGQKMLLILQRLKRVSKLSGFE